MRMIRPFFVLGLIFSLGTIAFGWEGVVETTTKNYQLTGKPQLILRNPDGKIKLSQGPEGSVQIVITKEVTNAKDEADAKKKAESIHVDIDQTGNRIEAKTIWPSMSGWFHLGIHRSPQVMVTYEVITPHQSDIRAGVVDGVLLADGFDGTLELSTVDGELSASNLSGSVNVSGVDGRVDVSNLEGAMTLTIVDGKLTATHCTGALTVKGVDGGIQLHQINGTVDARASDGKLTIDGVLHSVSAKTVDGKIDIQLMAGSALQQDSTLSTSDGDIQVQLPQEFQADLDLYTSDGTINTQLPIMVTGSFKSNRLSGKLNNGGNLLSIRTSDGDILIR